MVSITQHATYFAGRYLSFLKRPFSLTAGLIPKGLYARALIIIITPIVLLESLVAFVFMERHWETVTRRLSTATTRDVAMLINVYQSYPHEEGYKRLIKMARDSLNLNIHILPPGDLPAARAKPFFTLLDRTLSAEMQKRVNKPFWIDTVGRSNLVEIRVKLPDAVLHIIARRSQTYASNSHIFLLWMVGTSLVLLTVAILFLRNQIKPILRLSEAAETFGMGRPVPTDFKARGAREVRQASQSFLEMRDRIERHVEQRTTMLAGVSHDLRTILTRFKLQLAMFEDSEAARGMQSDVNEMQHMLEDYVAFAKGDGGEKAKLSNVYEIMAELKNTLTPGNEKIELERPKMALLVLLRRHAFKRAVENLITNATRYADRIVLSAKIQDNRLWIEVDDDGPGIPLSEREQVFRPFYRLDQARNQDLGHSGLGLAIARDIARSHGGDIYLEDSPLGGLKALMKVPV